MFLFGDVLPSVNLVTPIFRIVFVEMICVCFLLYVKETFRMGSVFFFFGLFIVTTTIIVLLFMLYQYIFFLSTLLHTHHTMIEEALDLPFMRRL